MIYSWRDAQGVTHHTNKEYEIPVRYRTKVKARFPEATDSVAPQPNLQAGAASLEPPPSVQPGKADSQPPAVSADPPNSAIKRGIRRERRARRTGSEEE